LITGDDVYRPIKTLSGGEKNKLVLATLTTLHPNLLILDEPTNHLDMASREALAIVLKEFKGTLILVSHDRWLLDEVTDHTLDLRKTGAVLYPGNYSRYRAASKQGQGQRVTKVQPTSVGAAKPTLTPRELSKEIQRVEKLVEDLEEQVREAERDLAELEQTLANLPPTADVLALTQSHSGMQERIAGLMSAWEEQSVRAEELRAQQAGS
jgi:ATP-binding cassette subfamily F protein 3